MSVFVVFYLCLGCAGSVLVLCLVAWGLFSYAFFCCLGVFVYVLCCLRLFSLCVMLFGVVFVVSCFFSVPLCAVFVMLYDAVSCCFDSVSGCSVMFVFMLLVV